jgi:hypothetical protein
MILQVQSTREDKHENNHPDKDREPPSSSSVVLNLLPLRQLRLPLVSISPGSRDVIILSSNDSKRVLIRARIRSR